MIGFPLLQKELLEQAAKEKTYIVRIIFGVAFYTLFFTQWYASTKTANWNIYGKGKEVIEVVFFYQFAFIFLFVPPLIASIISYEKEKSTILLLLISKLHTREIITEKLLGRLLPVFSLLLMTAPSLAISYSIGGVTPQVIVFGLFTVFLYTLQISAVTLMCSCYCTTTTKSLIASYLFNIGFYFFLPGWETLKSSYVSSKSFLFFLPRIFFEELGNGVFTSLIAHAIAIAIISTIFFIVLAAIFFRKRALVVPKNFLRKIFSYIDAVLKKYNQKMGDIELRKSISLPQNNPIAWREKTTKSLGKFNYKLRIFIVLQGLTLLFLLNITVGYRYEKNLLSFHIFAFHLALVVISILSANIIATERAKQTLAPLLTTPISSRDIILQKMQGINSLIWVFMFPLFTIVAFKIFLVPAHKERIFSYIIYSTIFTFLHLFMLRWVMLWIGFKAKRKLTITVLVFVALAIWHFAPLFAAKFYKYFFNKWKPYAADLGAYIMVFSLLIFFARKKIMAAKKTPKITFVFLIAVSFLLTGAALCFSTKNFRPFGSSFGSSFVRPQEDVLVYVILGTLLTILISFRIIQLQDHTLKVLYFFFILVALGLCCWMTVDPLYENFSYLGTFNGKIAASFALFFVCKIMLPKGPKQNIVALCIIGVFFLARIYFFSIYGSHTYNHNVYRWSYYSYSYSNNYLYLNATEFMTFLYQKSIPAKITIHFVFFFVFYHFFKQHCLKNSDEYLGRNAKT